MKHSPSVFINARCECNLAAVWGQMSTGGHSQLQEVMSVVGVPVMSKASFISTERDIGEIWRQELTESMAAAGREEKQMAEEKGHFHEGVPAITVIVDGGWSKRTNKHSYNANSQSSSAKKWARYCTLVYVTSTATLVQETFPVTSTPASETGMPHLLR